MSDEEATEGTEAQTGPTGTRAADLGLRFAARTLDFVLLFVVFGLITVPAGLLEQYARIQTLSHVGNEFSARRILTAVFWAFVVIGYFSIMEWLRGQTVGKMLVRLQTQGPDGEKPSLAAAVKRNVWLALTVVPIVGDLATLVVTIYIAATISQSATNTGWHDRFAGGTRVVRIG